MKTLVIVIAVLFATPAAAWLAPQGEWSAAIARGDFNPSPRDAALLRCFQDRPWSGDFRRDGKWLDSCIAKAPK